MLGYHIIAFGCGFLLDLLLGDPHSLPHPVRLIGRLVTAAERWLRGGRQEESDRHKLIQGAVLVGLVLFIVESVVTALLLTAYRLHPALGVAVETVMTYQLLAVKSLKVESMKVYHCLQAGSLQQAREAVSMIVGRDTACLDEAGVVRAAVETVAENTSDGAIAPMLYLAVGGPVLGFFHKTVNTMDSMIGYRNDDYLYFGRAAARLDDLVNLLPARISALLMLVAAYLLGRGPQGAAYYSAAEALAVYRRDRRKHASPNAGQMESVCAGALGVRLGGDAVYFGRTVHKPYIGEERRHITYEEIGRANRLLYLTAWLCQLLCLVCLGVIAAILRYTG